MEFEWDKAKSEDCYVQRGFDFLYAIRASLDPKRTTLRDSRRDYGEERYRLLGEIEGRVFVVVFTVRNSVLRIISARKANKREVRNMPKTRVRIDPGRLRDLPVGRVDHAVLDATTEQDIAAQQRQDDAEARRDTAKFVRRVRKRLGFTQQEFARRIDVPQETIRNWEQGKRCPTGPARALLRVLDKAPETALFALT